MIKFKCTTCGAPCIVTGSAARNSFVKLCSECDSLEKVELQPEIETVPTPPMDFDNVNAFQQELFK